MKEDFRIFSEPRPIFQRVVEKQLSVIENIQDNDQKQKAKDDLFNRLSLIHQRSLTRYSQISVAIRGAVHLADKMDDAVVGFEICKKATNRGYAQKENRPTYDYVLETMKKLKAPVVA